MKKILLPTVCAAVLMMGSFGVCAQEAPEGTPMPPAHEMKMPPRPEDMAKKLAEELNLTAEQRASADKIREDGRAKMKPLMEERKALHEKMEAMRKANMEEFEKILTDEQKSKFEEIKAKHKEHRGHRFGHRHERNHGPKVED